MKNNTFIRFYCPWNKLKKNFQIFQNATNVVSNLHIKLNVY